MIDTQGSSLKYIDLSGYSFSGKGAYNNLFAEFSGFHTHPYDFEFDLVRTKDGILDLYLSLVDHWSPVRSSEAIRRFRKLIQTYGGHKTFWDRLTRHGRHYDTYFAGFSEMSEIYINSLINSSWRGQWPFAHEQKTGIQVFCMKVLYNLGYQKSIDADIYLSAPEKATFLENTRAYLDQVLHSKVANSVVVMNNVFEPFDPALTMQFFSNAKSIVIDRDPRDIYLAALAYTNSDGSKGWKATTGKNVNDFIERFSIYRNHVKQHENSAILRISFEELVLEYEKTLQKLFDFLEVDRTVHRDKKIHFDPDVSKAGVYMWKNVDGTLKEDVEKIAEELGSLCLEIEE
jgi:hypothetical protein